MGDSHYGNYSKNLNSSFYSWNFDLSYSGGLLQEVKSQFCIETTPLILSELSIKILTKRDQFTK
jgi:hypothetical protein